MAYIIAVEIIVNLLVAFALLALFVNLGAISIAASALIMLSFKGLLELAKSFLDPFGMDTEYSAHNIRVDLLVSEVNFGLSQRWIKAGDRLPLRTAGDDLESDLRKDSALALDGNNLNGR